MDGVIRRVLPVLAAALLVAGCGGALPQVRFAAGPAGAVAGPAQYCDLDLTDCTGDPAAPVELAVPPGTPLQITVPAEVAAAPWHVVFTYRDSAGQQVDERSPLFGPGQRSLYTLELPTPDARLIEAQVQQFGPAPAINPETGEIEFPVRASWVVRASA